MKKLLVVLAIAAITLMAGAAMATVVGTMHDLSGGAGEICVYCHTPHGAIAGNGPLWNRNNAQADIVTGTYKASTQAIDPTGSTVCLSCHDGGVSAETLANGPGSGGAGVPSGGTDPTGLTLIATDAASLSNDHPIGGNAVITNADFNTLPLRTYDGAGNADLTGVTGNVECATCHDVHDVAAVGALFLRIDNSTSGLCLNCHDR